MTSYYVGSRLYETLPDAETLPGEWTQIGMSSGRTFCLLQTYVQVRSLVQAALDEKTSIEIKNKKEVIWINPKRIDYLERKAK